MSRNLRSREHPAPNPVSTYPIAPHRFLWEGFDDSYRETKTYKEFKAGMPYNEGDVVYMDIGGGEARLAYISDVFIERDHWGDRREKYRVHVATKTGDRFAKNWIYTYPGIIQRGYKLAGLAPDMPA